MFSLKINLWSKKSCNGNQNLSLSLSLSYSYTSTLRKQKHYDTLSYKAFLYSIRSHEVVGWISVFSLKIHHLWSKKSCNVNQHLYLSFSLSLLHFNITKTKTSPHIVQSFSLQYTIPVGAKLGGRLDFCVFIENPSLVKKEFNGNKHLSFSLSLSISIYAICVCICVWVFVIFILEEFVFQRA